MVRKCHVHKCEAENRSADKYTVLQVSNEAEEEMMAATSSNASITQCAVSTDTFAETYYYSRPTAKAETIFQELLAWPYDACTRTRQAEVDDKRLNDLSQAPPNNKITR